MTGRTGVLGYVKKTGGSEQDAPVFCFADELTRHLNSDLLHRKVYREEYMES